MRDIKINDINIHIIILGFARTNCYIACNNTTKEAIVIDPADQFDVIAEYIKKNNYNLCGILITHGHFDHILATKELVDNFGVKVYANKKEQELLVNSTFELTGTIHNKCEIRPDVFLEDEEIIHLAGFKIRTIHTPGHTSGGICYYFEEDKVLFSGDTLFRETIGRTDLPTGSFPTIISSIKDKLMLLEDEVLVFPGHGESTTIGYERENNEYLGEDRLWE